MGEKVEILLGEIEDLLYALTIPDRKISGKNEAASLERYLMFCRFRRAVIRLLHEIDKLYEEHNTGENS